ncbi:hypothetical protein L6R29_26145 [Myxococcota bacterium]|nr:hypothetical protein [Myxococcota bacterium]
MSQVRSVEIQEFPAMFESHKSNEAELEALLKGDVGVRFGEAMALGQKLRSCLLGGGVEATKVDRLLDRGWGGLSRVLVGWEHSLVEDEQIPSSKEERDTCAYIRALRVGLIGEGLGFLGIAFMDEWRESGVRLARLDTVFEGGVTYRQALEKLGLGLLVGRIERLQEMYGQALGITKPKETMDAYAAWEKAFSRLLHGVYFTFGDESESSKKVDALLVKPYEAALERGLERRRRNRPSEEKAAPSEPSVG